MADLRCHPSLPKVPCWLFSIRYRHHGIGMIARKGVPQLLERPFRRRKQPSGLVAPTLISRVRVSTGQLRVCDWSHTRVFGSQEPDKK